MQTNTRQAWQDVPEVMTGGNGYVRTAAEKAEVGTFRNAGLISPYFRIENFKTDGKAKWHVPYRSKRMAELRSKLADVKRRWGKIEQTGMLDRPLAGQPILPMPVETTCKVRPLPPAVPCSIASDFRIPADQLIVPGLDWRFRMVGHYRILGIEWPRKEA